LPLDRRGYPIPYFVATLPDGSRDFRVADGKKRVKAVNERLCWICGEKLGRYLAFTIGPMCAVNRNTSEPPSHRECAEFAAQACPFMTLPAAQYRSANLPAGILLPPEMLDGNPGAVCIWICQSFKPYKVEDSWLIRLGEPTEVLWFAYGKPATRQQILDCFEKRLPFLANIAKEEGPEAEAMLASMTEKALELLPA
jgi:hypothetical protein